MNFKYKVFYKVSPRTIQQRTSFNYNHVLNFNFCNLDNYSFFNKLKQF